MRPRSRHHRAKAIDLTRVLLFTGKGGVGKTSIAAATAVRAAAAGHRVLVTSTDPAHSLADVLDVPVGDAPTAIAVAGSGALHAQQIDAQRRLEQHWRQLRDYLTSVLANGGVDRVQAEELVLLPGLDELFALVDLNAQVGSGRYDLVVVDCAPTAETLRLLALPDALGWYVRRVLGPGRAAARVARPVARSLLSAVPVPDDGVFGEVGDLHAELEAVHALLQDTRRSSVRLVTAPERLVVAESQRTVTTLSLFGYGLDAVVLNRLLPDGITDPVLSTWADRQAEQADVVRRGFAPTPVLTVGLLPDEPVGAAALARLADQVYGERDETALLHDGRPVLVAEGEDGQPRLLVALPFATDDDLELSRRGADLHLRVAGVKRVLPLPVALARHEVAGARLADGWLELRFAPAQVAEEVPAP